MAETPLPEATLFVVATPIGHLGDLTARALETLRGVDVVACEDTRMTKRLTGHYAIATPLISYHEHNGEAMRPKLLERLGRGERIALVSDAGTPLISDPGYKLVREVQEAGHKVVTVPGPSSVIAALSIAGLPTDRFFFAGFLPTKSAARQKELHALKSIPGTLVLFEAAQRVEGLLRDVAAILGEREVALARELTKTFEEVRRGPVATLLASLAETPARGECVVLVGPPGEADAPLDTDALLKSALATMHVGDAARHVAALTGESRKHLYEKALKIEED